MARDLKKKEREEEKKNGEFACLSSVNVCIIRGMTEKITGRKEFGKYDIEKKEQNYGREV